MEREKAKIPYTMTTLIPLYRKERSRLNSLLIRRKRKLATLLEYNQQHTISIRETNKHCSEKDFKALDLRMNEVHILTYTIKGINLIDATLRNTAVEAPRSEFLCPCPRESCRGLVDGTKYTCMLCESPVCPQCQELHIDGHQCDPVTKKTIEALKVDTKPCPGCAVPITWLEGCDQMFCTACHVIFSWKTGSILRRVRVHNPHAIEWQNRTGNTANLLRGDVCGGISRISGHRLGSFTRYIKIALPHMDKEGAHRLATNIEQSVRHAHAWVLDEQEALYDEYRIRYIIGDYSEDEWADKLYNVVLKVKKLRILADVYELYSHLGTERIRHYVEKHYNAEEFYVDICYLRRFVNEILTTEFGLHGVKAPLLSERFIWSEF